MSGIEIQNIKGKRMNSKSKSLFVSRRLLNEKEIRNWAKEQNLVNILYNMHVTTIFSRKEMDWSLFEPEENNIVINYDSENPFTVEKFGVNKNVIVLHFTSLALRLRNKFFMECGCSAEHPEFKSHVSITFSGENADISKIVPYSGSLFFGPEMFEEIKEVSF